MSPREELRSRARWLMGYGLPGGMIRLGARRGDLISRMVVDTELHRDPSQAYERLRAEGPLVDSVGISASVDHATCKAIMGNPQLGQPKPAEPLPAALGRIYERLSPLEVLSPIDPPSMLAVDPPQHTRYRKQVAKAFTNRKVGGMAERVEEVGVRLLDELADEPGFDLVDRYAALLPVAVISDILGVPEDERPRVLELGNLAALTLDPVLTLRQYREAENGMRELHARFAEHVARLRNQPGDDLLSQIITAESDDPLTETELHQVGLLVLGAGFETTVNLIGNAVVQLDRHPDQLDTLLEEPDGWANAVEETLRFDPPVQMIMRTARGDTEIAGTAFGRGRSVLGIIGGANRDPAVFDDPDRFDVRRANAGEHLSFSAGVHHCLGANLARLEATVALRLLYDRFPDLRLTAKPERRSTRVLRGYEHIPVTVGSRARARVA